MSGSTKIYLEYRRWGKKRVPDGDGVLLGSDSAQEWLLPWWWEHYSQFNHHPVTWVDLGMTEKMQNWCRERGSLIRLRVADIFVTPQEEIAEKDAAYWENVCGFAFWNCRNAWFKKPLAFLQT